MKGYRGTLGAWFFMFLFLAVSCASVQETRETPDAREARVPGGASLSSLRTELAYEDFERFDPGVILASGASSVSLGMFTAETFEGGTVSIEETEAGSGGRSRALKIANEAGFAPGNKAKLSFIAGENLAKALGSARVQIEFRGRNERAGASASMPYAVSARNEVALAALFSDSGGFRLHNETWKDAGSYSLGRWYDVKVLLDYPKKTFDYYVDGRALVTGGKFRSGSSTDLREIMWYVDRPGAAMYVDNIRITTDLAEILRPVPPLKEAEILVRGDTARVIIDRDYVLGRLTRYLPLDIALDRDTGEAALEVSAEAAETIRSLGGRVRLYSEDFQILLGTEIFGGKGERSFLIRRGDPGAASGGPGRRYAGRVYEVRASREGTEITELGGNMVIKESGVVDREREGEGGPDRFLALMRLVPGGDPLPANGKHDLAAGGIRLEVHTAGTYGAFRTDFSFADLSPGEETLEYARILCGRGVMEAPETPGGNFNPAGTLSVSRLAATLARALDMPELADLSAYENAPPGAASPAGREDMALLVTGAYLRKSGRELEDLDKYYDGGALVASDARNAAYLKAAWVMGFLTEKRSGNLAPREHLTRAEAAKAIVIMLESLLLLDKNDGFENLSLEDILSSPVLHRSYNLYPPLTYVNAAPGGALGKVNIDFDQKKRDTWYIEEQRWVASDLMYELLRQRYVGDAGRDDAIVRGAFNVFKWGFDQQRPDGSFPNNPDAYHSAYFILEALGRTLYLYKHSGDGRYKAYLDEYRDKLARTASWLNNDENFNRYRDSGAFITFTHRNFLLASALLLAADVSGGNEGWEKRAQDLLAYGLFRMTGEGLFPERDGFDAGYQQTSIEYLVHSYALTKNLILKSDLREAANTASAYSLIRFDDRGNIDLSDSTRSGGQEAKRDGAEKTASERTYHNMLNKSFSLLARPDIERAIRHMAVRQGYITAAFSEYWLSGRPYNFEFDRPVLPEARRTRAGPLAGMSGLPVQSVRMSESGASAAARSLIDGSLNSVWSTRPVAYAVFDLGQIRDVGGMRIAFNDRDKKTCYYGVMVSADGIDWQYASEDNRSGEGQWSECVFSPVKARYVKLWIGQARPFTRANMTISIGEVTILGK
jgi:hypothetical protein